jgi:anti-sigma factor RsiW
VSSDPLKGNLRRIFAEDRAPERLADEVRNRLRREVDAIGVAPLWVPPEAPVRVTVSAEEGASRVASLWIVPAGIAAAMAFVWLATSVFERPGPLGPKTAVEAQWVSAGRATHRHCVAMGGAHQSASLPKSGSEAQAAMSAELRVKVLAPDLSKYGFSFQSADRCGFNGASGAHIVYERRDDGKLLSIFTLANVEAIAPT